MDKRILDKRKLQQVKSPTNPSTIHRLHTHIHKRQVKNHYEEVPIRPSSSGQAPLHSSSVLLCTFSMSCLYPSITSLSLPLPTLSTIKFLCKTGGGVGVRIVLSVSPTHRIHNLTTKRTVGLTCFKPVSRTRKGSSVVRWLLGATEVIM